MADNHHKQGTRLNSVLDILQEAGVPWPGTNEEFYETFERVLNEVPDNREAPYLYYVKNENPTTDPTTGKRIPEHKKWYLDLQWARDAFKMILSLAKNQPGVLETIIRLYDDEEEKEIV